MVDFKIEVHLASTEMQRVPSLVEEKYLGAAIWVRRPTESALNIFSSPSPPRVNFSRMQRVVMGLGLVGALGGWVGFPYRKADHRMVGRCLGEGVQGGGTGLGSG